MDTNVNGNTPAPSSAADSSVAPPAQRLPALPGETPRAYSAFSTFVDLGHDRTLQMVADQLGEEVFTIKKWSSKYQWTSRVQNLHAGLLSEQVQNRADILRQSDEEWASRLEHLRQQEWEVAQKLLGAARCFLESFGEDDLTRMTLAHVSRALNLSSTIARRAVLGVDPPDAMADPELPRVPTEALNSIRRVYGMAAASASPASAS
jgi:hypothetical protein